MGGIEGVAGVEGLSLRGKRRGAELEHNLCEVALKLLRLWTSARTNQPIKRNICLACELQVRGGRNVLAWVLSLERY